MLTCQCYVTVHLYPRFSHLKSLASYLRLQVSSTLPYVYYSFLLQTSAIQSLTQIDLDKAVVQNGLAASSTSSICCDFCGLTGHAQPKCRQYAHAKEQIVKNKNNRKKDKANTAKTPETSTEFPGNASAPSTSPSPIPPNFDWLADTEATSHIMPHHHWVRNYFPPRIPIKLADN